MNIRMMIALGLAATTAMACGPDDKENGEPVSHLTARQAITDNTTSVAERISASLSFLESSALIPNLIPTGYACGSIDDGSGADFDSGECDGELHPVEINTDLGEPTAQLTEYLETRIFADANIEASSAASVTYLLRGDVVCDGGEEAPDPDCVTNVNDAQIRLKVTSPANNDIDVEVQVGPQRHKPLFLEFHQSSLAAEVDLNALKGAVAHLAPDTTDFPDTFTGRIRGEIAVNSPNSVTGTISVLSAVAISGSDEIALSVAASDPTFQVVVDGTGKTISAALDLGAMHLMGPIGSGEEWDDELQDYVETPIQTFDLNIAGASGSITYAGASDSLTFTNLGLGSTASTMKVDGAQILSVLINDGGTFSATIADTADGTSIEVSPKFDLTAVMNFAAMGDDFDAWMNDTLRVTLDGAPAPKLLIVDEQTQVVAGQLMMSLANAGKSVTVAANQCLLIADDEIDDSNEPVEPPESGDEQVDPIAPPEDEEVNPFDNMSAGACE